MDWLYFTYPFRKESIENIRKGKALKNKLGRQMDESNVTFKAGKSHFSVPVVSAGNGFRSGISARDDTRNVSIRYDAVTH